MTSQGQRDLDRIAGQVRTGVLWWFVLNVFSYEQVLAAAKE